MRAVEPVAGPHGWYVLHSGSFGHGVLRRERTRAAAVQWCARWYWEGQVFQRVRIDSGCYEKFVVVRHDVGSHRA